MVESLCCTALLAAAHTATGNLCLTHSFLLPCAAHDLYFVHENRVQHWSSTTQRTRTVLDVSGGVTGAVAPGLGQVQLCTLCAKWVGLLDLGAGLGAGVVKPRGSLPAYTAAPSGMPREAFLPRTRREGLVAGGGFSGELVAHRIGSADKFACRCARGGWAAAPGRRLLSSSVIFGGVLHRASDLPAS